MKKIFFVTIAVILLYSIHAQGARTYVENQLIIWLEPGVDAYEFAANSAQNIRPKDLLSRRLNIWLFEFTDEVRQRTAIQRTLLGQGSALFILSKQVLPEKITAKQL